jgi:HPt (histidine-containing phosphotransfer) domain-containing protein
MIAEIENAARAQDGDALRRASHKLKGSLLQFSGLAAVSAAAELEHCADNHGMENAPALIEAVKKETDFLMQMLQAMVSDQRTDVKTERGI